MDKDKMMEDLGGGAVFEVGEKILSENIFLETAI